MGFFTSILNGKKKVIVIGFVSIILLIVLLSPYIVGVVFEKKINKAMSALKEKLPSKMDLVYKIDRSYMTSKVNLEFRVMAKDGSGSIFSEITFNHTSLSAISLWTVDRAFQVTYLSRVEKLPTIEIHTDIGLTGTLKNRTKIASLKLLRNDSKEYSWEIEGFNARVFLNKTLSLELLELSLARIKAENNEKGVKHDITNASFMLDTETKDSTFDSLLELSFDKYLSLNSNYGPGILEFETKRISIEVLDGIKKLLDDFRKYASGDDSSNDDFKTKLLGRTMTILPALVKSTPRLEIKSLKLKTEKGDFIGQGHFSIPKSDGGFFSLLSNLDLLLEFKSPEFLFMEIFKSLALIKKKQGTTSPEDMLKAAEKIKKSSKGANTESGAGDADANAKDSVGDKKDVQLTAKDEADAVKEATTTLEQAYASKYLVKSGEEIKFKFEYKDGSMKLNGDPFSFPFKK
ncbi:MAG: DUF945 family protein [Oligoflexia bacterium]|nr:DUF945 family protein [Oligoflexia bacterium]